MLNRRGMDELRQQGEIHWTRQANDHAMGKLDDKLQGFLGKAAGEILFNAGEPLLRAGRELVGIRHDFPP